MWLWTKHQIVNNQPEWYPQLQLQARLLLLQYFLFRWLQIFHNYRHPPRIPLILLQNFPYDSFQRALLSFITLFDNSLQ